MIKSFEVAGHRFNVALKEGHPLWGLMGQYAMFECAECDEPIFTLELARDLEPDNPVVVYDQPTEPGETKLTLYRTGDGWYCTSQPTSEHPVCGWLLMNGDFTKGTLKIRGSVSDATFALNNALMLLYAFRTAGLGTLEMHASVVRNDGKGYLFVAKSGTGKSTHSSLWLKHVPGSTLLNDDNPIVRVFEDGTARVYGSPWSGKTPCYVKDDCPIGGIVKINRAPFDRLDQAGLLEAYAMVYSSCSGFKTDAKMGDAIHDNIARLVENTPCYTMNCLPDKEAAIVCSEGVRK